MKILNYLLFVACFSFTVCCTTTQKIAGLYANEYGEIRLIEENDTLMRTIFKNNEGNVFDTTMFINYNFNLISKQDSLPFLQLGMAGIELHPECLFVHEFSDFAYFPQFIQIEEMYTRPFYKVNEEVTVNGDVIFAKGTTINGIWLGDSKETHERYVSIHGTIKKEKYPKGYYSTDESPQGMFSDTSIVHYRLIMEDYIIEDVPTQTFKGSTVNIDNQAVFIYDFADSEVFYLDGLEKWEDKYLNKKITIEGTLVQFIDGKSVIKNWKILE